MALRGLLYRCYLDRWASLPQPEQPRQELELPVQLLEETPTLNPSTAHATSSDSFTACPREEIAAQTGLTELRAKGHLQYALKLLSETIMSKCLPFASPGEVSADV